MSILSVNGHDALNKVTTTYGKNRLDYQGLAFLHAVMPLIETSLRLETFKHDQLIDLFVSRECGYVWANIKRDSKKHLMEKKERDKTIFHYNNQCEIVERKMRAIAQENLALLTFLKKVLPHSFVDTSIFYSL